MADTSSEIFEYKIIATDEASAVFQKIEEEAMQAADAAIHAADAAKKTAEGTAALAKELASEQTWHFQKFEQQSSVFGRVGDKVGSTMLNLGKSSKALQERLEPSAAAIGAVGAALGQTGGAMGQFMAAAGPMLAAFSVGGPVGVGLVAATLAFDSYSASVAKAEEAHRLLLDELKKTPATLQTQWDAVTQAKELAVRYQQDAANIGKENWQIDAENMQKQIDQIAVTQVGKDKLLETEKESLRYAERAYQLTYLTNAIASDNGEEALKRLEIQKQIVTNLDTEIREAKKSTSDLEASIWAVTKAEEDRQKRLKELGLLPKITVDKNALSKAQQEAVDALSSEVTDVTPPDVKLRMHEAQVEIDIRRMALDQQAENERQYYEDKEKREEEAAKKSKETYEGVVKEYQDGLKEMAARNNAFWTDYAGAANSALGIASGAFSAYLDAKIKGEENAEALFIASILRQSGQVFVGKGMELMAEGIKNTATLGGSVIGIPQMGIAAGMIATGVGLGAAGAAVEQSVQPPKEAEAKQVNEAVKTAGAEARKNSKDSAGPSQGSITIVYNGLTGPNADQGARNLVKGQALARARGYDS